MLGKCGVCEKCVVCGKCGVCGVVDCGGSGDYLRRVWGMWTVVRVWSV